MGQLHLGFEIAALVVLVAILLTDLLLVIKRPHLPSMKECAAWIGFYVSLALIFAVVLFFVGGMAPASEFVTGWLLEYSLSIDNLFVFIVIMSKFAVPKKYQQEVLMVGIIIALIARALFIVAGAVIINSFAEVFYIFGLFLLYTAWKQTREEEDDGSDSFIMRTVRRVLPVSEDYDGNNLRTVVNGKKLFTPMLLVFITIGLTDVMFALDSIPAIFAVTQNPFLVFTANLFALMGLRQLYFLLGGLMERLAYLHYGIAAILGFIGIKLLIHAIHEAPLHFIPGFSVLEKIPEVPIWLSLSFILVAMGGAIVASLLFAPKTPTPSDDESPSNSEH